MPADAVFTLDVQGGHSAQITLQCFDGSFRGPLRLILHHQRDYRAEC